MAFIRCLKAGISERVDALAVHTALAAVGAALAAFFADKATAEGGETCAQASAVLLLAGRLLGRALLVLHLLGWISATAILLLGRVAALLGVASLGRAVALRRVLRLLVVVLVRRHCG